MIYVVVFLIAFAGMLAGAPRTARNQLTGLVLLLMLGLIACIRVDTGTDFQTYTYIWDAAPPTSQLTWSDLFGGFYEPLFYLTTSLLKEVTREQSVFFATFACLTLAILHTGIRRLPISWPYAYLLYFSTFYLPYLFNAMRQAVAMSLLIAALPAMLERRWMRVLLLTMIAGGFHSSGFLIGVGYVFLLTSERLGLDARKTFLAVVLLGGAMAASGVIGRLFFAVFPTVTEVYSELFDAASTPASIGLRLALCVLMLHFATREGRIVKPLNDLLIVYFLGLFIYLALLDFNMLATRFNMFFRVMEVALFPLVARQQRGVRRVVFVAFTLALSIAALWTIGNDPDYRYESLRIF